MLFGTATFLYGFLPVALAGFFLAARRSAALATLWLAACSLFFYGWWDVRFVSLLLASIAFNYTAGLFIRRAGPRGGLVLGPAVAANLALLGYFKYRGFFSEVWHGLNGSPATHAALVLPLGISFFTFTQIAFLVDVRRGQAREYRFDHYLLFVTYFPHLIAGPILHHGEIMPQFAEKRTYRWNWDNVAVGLTIFIIGLGKKMFLADAFGAYANPVFALAQKGGHPWFCQAWVGALSFAFQLYFDFSGYSDMAIGLSRLFNVKLPLNFASPYKAASIIEFWRRWHITLSRFLRDYLYIPLGGNRHGVVRRHGNLLATMVLGGLWHGAGWTFIAWGALHGVYLVINHLFRDIRRRLGWRDGNLGWIGHCAATVTTFLAVTIGWVFFRAETWGAAISLLRSMSGFGGVSVPSNWRHLGPHFRGFLRALGFRFDGWFPPGAELQNSFLLLGLGFAIVWGMPNTQQWLNRHQPALGPAEPGGLPPALQWDPTRRWAAAAVMILLFAELLYLGVKENSPFLYFQF